MNHEEFFYLLPYIFSLALSLGIFFYAWKHRQVRGVWAYSWFASGQVLVIFGFIVELISPALQTKLFWDAFQWLVDFNLIILPFLIFSIQFSEYKIKHTNVFWGCVTAILISFSVLLLTDPLHHLIYPDPHLSTDYPFPELQYSFTPVVYIYSLLFMFGPNLFGIWLLTRRAFELHGSYRIQYLTIAAGFLIPVLASVLSLADIRIAPQRDITPFALAIGNAVVALGIFRYRLFDLVPIAREHIIENMSDPVFVLDAQNRIVDINGSALAMLNKKVSDALGQPAQQVFAELPVIVGLFENPPEKGKEVSIPKMGESIFFDIDISLIYDRQKEVVGRIIIARDITRHKTLEMNYRALSEDLEERVRERTEELRKSAERYRTVVENQTEFIVRWKPDRTHTFVNEAYCRYFGLTWEQAMQIDSLTFIADVDRQQVEDKIRRLIAGETNSETGIQRSLRPDGTVRWHEWTDHPIRDENGNVIEFQSIGRDITEQRQAEEALRRSEAIYRQAIEVAGGVPYHQSYQYYDDYRLNITYDFIGEGIRQISGYGPEEITETLWDSLVKESNLVGELAKYSWDEAIQRVRTGEQTVWQCEYRIVNRQGETRWIYEVSVEIRGKDGKSHGSIGLYQDITERKRAEEEIRKLSRAVEQSNASIVITNTAGLIEYVNPYFSELTGYTFEEALGKNPRILQSGMTSKDTYSGLWQTIGNGQEWRGEFCNRKKNGELYWEEASISPITDSVGTITHYVAVKTDITERKRAEEAIRKSEEKFAKAFQSSPIIIAITRLKDARLLEVNETFEKVTGFRREDVINKSILDLDIWVDYEKRKEILSFLTSHNVIRGQEVLYRIKNGTILTCLLSAEMIELGNEQCILATIEDITKRKRSETRILRLNRLYATISQINQTIVHSRSKEQLFHEICRVATEEGQFRMAWVGWIDGQEGMVKPIVFAGDERGYLEGLHINYRDELTGRGPTGTAIREGRCIICQDIATDPRMATWRERALSRGYLSSAAVPLREHGQIVGALTVYADEPHGFDTEKEGLLEQIGMDVSFALDSIDAEIKRNRAEQDLEEAYDTTLEGWAKALELRDKETEGHSRRVTETTLVVARAMGFSEAELVHIRRGSILHDIGKMGIDDNILRKNGPLTSNEREKVQKHPITAYELLKPIAYLEEALDIPYCHHEKWDGSGYPRGLKTDEIPLAARIFAVVDVWDALRSDRPYRKAWSREMVMKYLIDESGKHFDPKVVAVFLKLVEKGEI